MKHVLHLLKAGLLLLIFLFSSCGEENNPEPPKISPEAPEIEDYVESLTYNPSELLNVQDIGGASSKREEIASSSTNTEGNGTVTVCSTKEYSLLNNFEEVAVLRPTNGVIYPGALVIGDSKMLGGLPTPVSIDRAPVTLRLDLPGIGEKGTIVVDHPSNSAVQTKIDEALEYWNNNAYQDGYVNASNSSYQTSTSYSSRQLSMDVGLNVEWAAGNVASQFNYTSSRTEKVAMMVFKQVFYTISLDVPGSPGEFFGTNTTTAKVKEVFSPEAPPAYVHSVAYGRIIMFRMITTAEADELQIKGAFNYATGLTNASGETEVKYKEILQKSSITTVTIGGNAEVASSAVSATNFGDLNPILTGENAVYSKSNPGVPIAYTVRYLKDNSFAKMGFTTDYAVESCTENVYPAKEMTFYNRTGPGADIGWDVRFAVYYKEHGSGASKSVGSGLFSKGKKAVLTVPAGAYGIRVEFDYVDGAVWKTLFTKTYDKPTQECFQAYGSWEVFGNKVPKYGATSCP